jgi:hypothetical protein
MTAPQNAPGGAKPRRRRVGGSGNDDRNVDRRVGLKAITGVDADEADRIVPPPVANRRQVRQRDAI